MGLRDDGARRGVMVAPGMKNSLGAVAPLVGPLRWAVDVYEGGAVRIERKPAPPPEVTAAVARNEANHPPSSAGHCIVQ